MKRAAVALGAAGLALGCSGVRAPLPRAQATAPPADPNAAFVTPARWDYHPPAPVTAISALKLPDGGCLFTAEGGQRWSAAATRQVGNRVTCSGPAEASLAVAPEDLTSAVRRASGAWLYVGETGALYEASEPLGAFTRTVPAPEPLAKVTGAGAGVLATTQEGKLLRWEDDKGWRAAAPSPALAGARVFDLAAGAGGRVLALGFPEALFASEDAGATWTAAVAPTVGARRLGSTGGGDLGAQGVFESVVWRGASFVRGPEKLLVPATSIAVDVGHGPSAVAVQAARAVLDGDRYDEVLHPENEGEPWLLARGRLEGRLETTPLPDSARCSNVRIGARGKVVLVACVTADGAEIAADLSRSSDGGVTWSEPVHLVTPDTDQIVIAVALDGSAVVTGVCRTADPGATCKPISPLLVREAPRPDGADAGKGDAGRVDGGAAGAPPVALRAVPVSAPQLSGAALTPIFSADGRAAYFLGRRGKDDRMTLFVSHDGGETFSPRTLQPAVLPRAPRREKDEGDDPGEGEPAETFDIDENSVLRPGDDGTLGLMVVRSRGGAAYVTADDDGRVLQVAGPPLDDEGNALEVVLTGYGRRVLALPLYLAGDGTSGTFWESLDGGASWDKQPMPQALVREYGRGQNISVACSAAGCLMGETVSRVGWGSTGEVAAAERSAETPPAPTPAVLTPIVCDLAPGTKWSRVEDLFISSPAVVPQVSEIMRGRSVWSALSLDRATGALTTVSATLPESGQGEARIVRRPLIGPRGAHTATEISATQVEGYAVARVGYPVDAHGQPKVGGPLRNLELTWENFLEGTSAHAHVADAGALERDDVEHTPAGDALRTGMLSITSHGLFVRVHHAHVRAGDEIFVDAAGRVERYASAPWPANGAAGALELRTDAAAVGGDLVDLGLVPDGDHAWSTAVVAKRGPGGWSYLAEALLPQRAGTALLAFTTWASSGKAPVGVTALVADPGHARAWAHYLGFRGDGGFWPAAPVATLYDLGDRPRPCTLAERAASPRAAMIFKLDNAVLFPGTRHPVLVQEARAKNAVGVAEPQVLLTSNAVVHGTPASPCLGAFQADSVVRGALVGAVIPGDLARSWLFRATLDGPRRGEPTGTTALEYRPMTCRYDGNARIPEVVWSQDGTSRP